MSLTRAQAEQVILRRVANFFEVVGLDYQTKDGSNVDLNDPIASDLRNFAIFPDDHALVDDDDLASLADEDTQQFFDIAELRSLESALNQYTKVDLKVGPRSEAFSDLQKSMEKRIAKMKDTLMIRWGFGILSLEAGVIDANFMSKGDDTVI